jgi:DNA-binding beta-propeller fold protein YncE
MQNSLTCGQSSSFMKPKLHRSAIALAIAAVISGHAHRWSRILLLGIVSLVFLAGCGGGTIQSLDNQPPAPIPTITTISPDSAVAGGAAFTLTITGTNFVTGSLVNFGGAAPTTTFVKSTQLTAAIPAAAIASMGMVAVTVTNPAPGGGTSNSITFTVFSSASTAPTISLLGPSCAPAGEPVQLTVVGNNFVASSVVRWNGSDRPTTSNGSIDGLIAQISASDVAAAGTVAVTVFNPGPGGGSSNTLTFTITAGAVNPQSIAVEPAGKFAYVASEGCDGGVGGYVSMYTINPTTGALESIGPPVPSNDEFTDSVTIDPVGKFACVASSGDVWDIDFGSVLTYAINPTTGALTSTTGGIGGTGMNGTPEFFNSVVLHPSGKFAYAADGGACPECGGSFGSSSSVSMYTVDSTTGALTPIGTIAAGMSPTSIAIHPSGKFAYVTNSTSNDVSMYSIDAATAALTLIATMGT